MSRIAIILAALPALAACGAPVLEPPGVSGADHRLVYQYGAVDSRALTEQAMEREATALCPAGWRVVSQRASPKGAGLAPEIAWEIACTD